MVCTTIHYPFGPLYAPGLVTIAHAVLGELRLIASDQDPGHAGARTWSAIFRTRERQALARPLPKKLDHDPIIPAPR